MTPWTVAHQSPLSMDFSRQEYQSRLPFPSPNKEYAAAAAKSLQSCPTLCDPIDGSPPRSPVPGILQARILEWVAISFSNAWKWKVKVKSLSHIQLLATPWTAAYQAPLSMGFSRQEYRSGLPFPSPGDLPNPGIEPRSPALQADALTSEPSLNSFCFSWIGIDSQERAFWMIGSVNSIHLVSEKAIKTYNPLAICKCALIVRPSVVVIYCLNFCQSDGNYLILYC